MARKVLEIEGSFKPVVDAPKPAKAKKPKPDLEKLFGDLLGTYGKDLPVPTRQLRFAKESHGRQWRFDFAWESEKLGCEIVGGTWVNGGHNRGKHIQSDIDKMNTAMELGWRVLQFTTNDIRQKPAQTMETIRKVLTTEQSK